MDLDRIALVMPGFVANIKRECDVQELRGVRVSHEFDKFVVHYDGKSTDVFYLDLIKLIDADDYDTISRIAAQCIHDLKDAASINGL